MTNLTFALNKHNKTPLGRQLIAHVKFLINVSIFQRYICPEDSGLTVYCF